MKKSPKKSKLIIITDNCNIGAKEEDIDIEEIDDRIEALKELY